VSSSRNEYKGVCVNKLVKKLGVLALLLFAGVAGVMSYQLLIAPQQNKIQHDFRILSGQKYTWGDLTEHWVVINYFAPWCAPCLREMPELNAFHRQLPENTLLFAINYDRKSESDLSEMAEKFNIHIPIIVAEDSTVLPMQKPSYLPATFIIGPDGKVADTIMGEVTSKEIKRRLTEMQSGVVTISD